MIGAEPAQADDGHRSFASGRIEEPTRYDTVADGLRTMLGERTFPIIRRHVEQVLLADDAEILAAMRLQTRCTRTVVEPSAAVPLAVVLKNPDLFAGRRVGIIVTGGNYDFGDCACPLKTA